MSYSEKEILYAVEHNDVTIISAETGSGKTTRTSFSIHRTPTISHSSRIHSQR